MSDDVKRVHGWPVGVPIKMVGGGEAFVVGERATSDSLVLSGYYINIDGNVVPIAWMSNGRKYIDCYSGSSLDRSFRTIPEPELPLWTIEDSVALLGKTLNRHNRHMHEVVLVLSAGNDARCQVLVSSGIMRWHYAVIQRWCTFLDGAEIPRRRFD